MNFANVNREELRGLAESLVPKVRDAARQEIVRRELAGETERYTGRRVAGHEVFKGELTEDRSVQ